MVEKYKMTVKDVRSLGKRDIENGAVKNEICDIIKYRDKLEQENAELKSKNKILKKYCDDMFERIEASRNVLQNLVGDIDMVLEEIEQYRDI